jgi:hypothetical protein
MKEKLDDKPTWKKVNKQLTYAIILRLAHSTVHRVHDNAEKITHSARLGTTVGAA